MRRRGRGEGNIERLPSGNFRAVVSLGYDPATKKRARVSGTFPTKREALDWSRKAHEELSAGTLTATSGTVGEWLTTWLEIRKPVKAPNTYRTERETAEKLVRPHLGPTRLRDLNPVVIERWLAKLAADEVSENERRKAAKLLRTLLNDAVKRRVIGSSPMKGVPVPTARPKESAALDHDQVKALVAAADDAGVGAMFRLYLDAGPRPGELFGFLSDDFDPAAGTISVKRAVCQTTGQLREPKTRRSRRTLLLAPSTAAALVALARPAGRPLFPTPTGLHYRYRNFIRDVFEPVVKAAKLSGKCQPYTPRHTMATLLLLSGVSLKVVSERLGHEDVATTLRSYAHVLPGMQAQAAAAMEGILNPPKKRSSHAGPTADGSTPVHNS